MELNSIYHHTKFESNRLINNQIHTNVTFFDEVCKTAFISLFSLNLTKEQYLDVTLELLQIHIKFHSDQFKSVREN